jgi:hypothetical protein
VTPAEEQKAIVRAFLARCRGWGAEREIPAALARLNAAPTPTDAAKLHQWTSWVAFVDHAVAELDAGALDAWFGGAPPPGPR